MIRSRLTNDVVAEKSENFIDVNFLDDVPESFDNVLDCFLAYSFVAETLNAWSPVGQNIYRQELNLRV